MKTAIDIDGTASAYPHQMAVLSHALRTAGLSVVLLTGHACPNPVVADRQELLAGRQAQVSAWGLSFDGIIVCVGRNSDDVAQQKAAYCRENGIGLFIDDSLNYCQAVKAASPATMVLHVWEK